MTRVKCSHCTIYRKSIQITEMLHCVSMNAQDISASRHKRDEQVDLSHITHWQCLVKHTSISIHNRAVTRGYHKYGCFNWVANRAFSNSCICLLVHLYLSSIICQYVILHHLMSIVLLTITHLCLNHLLFIWLSSIYICHFFIINLHRYK